MARLNKQAPGMVPGKFAPKVGEMATCALHKLPIDEKKGKRRVLKTGKRQLVEATYWVCPAGCCDPHVEMKGDEEVDVRGLVAWKRSLPIKVAEANLAEFKKDSAAYIAKTVPVPQPRKQVHFVPERIAAAPAEKPKK